MTGTETITPDGKPHRKNELSFTSAKEIDTIITTYERGHKKNLLILVGMFSVGLLGFFILYKSVPTVDNNIKFDWKFPRNVEQLKEMIDVARRYDEINSTYVTVLFVYLYILLQTFGLPGPALLGIAGGALFGPIKGFILGNLCATTGAICCYGMSYVVGKSIVLKFFPGLLRKFNKFMNDHKDNVFWYMLFLRVTPLLPNWFVNYASPIIGMPFKTFAIGSFAGLLPNTFVLVRTGVLLHEVSEFGLNFQVFFFLLVLALLALIPTQLSKRAKKQLEESEKTKNN